MDTTPGPVPVYRTLKLIPSAHQREDELPQTTNFSASATVGARLSPPRRHPWNSLDPHTKDIDHHAHVQSGNLNGLKDYEKPHLLHDRGVNATSRCGPQGSESTFTEKLHENLKPDVD